MSIGQLREHLVASIRQRKSGSWEIIIRRKNLPKPIYASADTYEKALSWANMVEAQLDAGIVPKEFAAPAGRSLWTVGKWLGTYSDTASPSKSDRPLLPIITRDIGQLNLAQLSSRNLGDWISDMKQRRLTPGSIKKRVGALARSLDIAVHREIISANVVRSLPRNYAAYTDADGPAVEDSSRDRRLEPGEEERIRVTLKGDGDWERLFTLALETAMRLRELYTLTTDQVDISKRTIFLEKTKNGDKRQIPLSSVALKALKNIPSSGQIFPWHTGDLRLTTMKLSRQFAVIAEKSGCHDLRFHDLRHEATCRIYERTSLTDLQISLITGHRDPRMLRRYSNLRGSDLASKMW